MENRILINTNYYRKIYMEYKKYMLIFKRNYVEVSLNAGGAEGEGLSN